MAERRVCPPCKRAFGHRPRDCKGIVQWVFPTVGPVERCECPCVQGSLVPLDVTGRYWPTHAGHPSRPLPVFARVSGGYYAEVTDPAEAERIRRERAIGPPPPVRPSSPPPLVTVPTRREQLVVDELATIRAQQR